VSAQDLIVCDLNPIIAETTKVLGDRFLHEVSIRFEAAPEVPRILGAPELIQQMLVNLIFNAADAMSGTGEIIVKTGELAVLPGNLALSPAAAENHAYVAVQDSGCGIAGDILPRIFEPFFTTKSFSTRRGTGLGLSMVYELAKQMGYGLKVTSSVGKGSTFTVLMPAHRSADL
jgi:signal transduction histidine kinase